MFCGIVEETAKVVNLISEGTNLHIFLTCSFVKEIHVDQSISHNGVCLTVVEKNDNVYKVTAIKETLDKTNLGLLKIGDEVNVERSMTINKLLDGHIVLGHVDQTGVCIDVKECNGSWYYTFEYDPSSGNFTVEKGSIAVNGVSLTVVNSEKGKFSVAIIPYTYQVTNFHNIKVGTIVNLEFDIIGKYLYKIITEQIEGWKKLFIK
ncbi:MAG: riboflavin synthase [Bacteroidales bacterium]|nr:riboflavin synthase [Bacteroidales bacterium]